MTEKQTVDDLVKSYHDTAARLKEIQDKTAEAKAELLTLLQKEVDQEDVPEEVLQKAKGEYDHFTLKAEAFKDRLDNLRGKIIAEVPEAARQGLEGIDEQFKDLSQKKETLNREFLAMAAKAAVLKERISGPTLLNTGRDHKATIPNLKVDMGRMSQEDSVYYVEQIEKARKANTVQGFGDSCEGRWRKLQQEKKRFEAVLQDPEREVERLIGGLPKTRPEAIKPVDGGQAVA